MSKLLKVIVMATAATFIVGCASHKAAPEAPMAPVEMQKPMKKCGGKHHHKCVADKLGQTSYKKDTKK